MEVVSGMISKQEVDKVLCIGVPSIHEHVKQTLKSIDTFLLDLDIRLVRHFN